jgi:F0F1-type ATP synthase membrane subunit a
MQNYSTLPVIVNSISSAPSHKNTIAFFWVLMTKMFFLIVVEIWKKKKKKKKKEEMQEGIYLISKPRSTS